MGDGEKSQQKAPANGGDGDESAGRSEEERERIEREMREQAKAAQDEPIEGDEREVVPRPESHEPPKKWNLHAGIITIGFGIFAVLIMVIIGFVVL